MKITVEIGGYREPDKEKPCEVEIYCDKEGLDYLIKELSKLNNLGDHAHFMTPSWGMDDLSEEKVVAENDLAHHLRLTLI
ncbi:MAG: immunity protein 32 [Proteobacteria bacterium]|jgi:hypothetical protein|nr:immunity protein 32 [Pseudomonadota bacterium]